MPKLELGDLEGVAELKQANIPKLAALARAGYAILAPIPSCGLMFKQELPLMFPDDEDVKAVQKAMFDPFEYLVARHKDGLLKTDFQPDGLGKVSYHVACHLRVQNVGQKTRELLSMLPQTSVHTVERCSGHAGTWGVKKEFHATAMKIGRPVFRQMAEHPVGGEPDWVASDCQLAGHHIAQGMQGKADGKLAHPLSLLRMAYGLPG
jgi:Fe-S oxidoreductase